MHQEHNIPWNLLASNFKFVRDNCHYTPRITGIFARQLPTQAESLNHFKRVLHKTITTFSETERQKYNATFPMPTSRSLFSDVLCDRHPKFLDREIIRNALCAYVAINLWAAMGLLEGGEYLEMEGYRRMVCEATMSMNGYKGPHGAYLDALPKDEKTGLPILHYDLEGLKEYLKTNFQLLYKFDMLMKERGRDPEWENSIVRSLCARAKVEIQVSEDGKYFTWWFV